MLVSLPHSLTSPSSDSEQDALPRPQSAITDAVVGGMMAVIAVLSVCVTITVTTCLALRHKRGK